MKAINLPTGENWYDLFVNRLNGVSVRGSLETLYDLFPVADLEEITELSKEVLWDS